MIGGPSLLPACDHVAPALPVADAFPTNKGQNAVNHWLGKTKSSRSRLSQIDYRRLP